MSDLLCAVGVRTAFSSITAEGCGVAKEPRSSREEDVGMRVMVGVSLGRTHVREPSSGSSAQRHKLERRAYVIL